jgi:hypothetical protein
MNQIQRVLNYRRFEREAFRAEVEALVKRAETAEAEVERLRGLLEDPDYDPEDLLDADDEREY